MNQQELFTVLKSSNKPRRLTVGYASTDTPGVDVPYLRLRERWLHRRADDDRASRLKSHVTPVRRVLVYPPHKARVGA